MLYNPALEEFCLIEAEKVRARESLSPARDGGWQPLKLLPRLHDPEKGRCSLRIQRGIIP
jgi:hypothetical protein